MRARFPSWQILIGVLLLQVAWAGAAEPTWQAGFAKVRITPEPGMWMAGYAARDHAAVGTLHDLWLKALALEDVDGRRAVLVTADLLGLPRGMYDSVCEKLLERCGLTRAEILLNASHTHSGPVLRDALYDIYPLDDTQRERIDEYSTRLEEAVVETVAAALEARQPARLCVGASSASFGINRRARRSGSDDAAAAAVVGPVDPTVPVLTVRTEEGELQVIVFGYACHCTTLSIDLWNGDYAGFAQLALESRFPGAEAMFVAGCGADQNPEPRRSVEHCQTHGSELADAVSRVVAGPMAPVSSPLFTAIARIDLPYGEQPGEETLRSLAEKGNYEARWASRLLQEMESGASFANSYPAYPVQVWQLGSYRLVALGGEVVVDYAIHLREQLGPGTWVAGYSNDVMAYIPSRRVWEEGGYEAGAFAVYGLPALRWAGNIEERILDTVVEISQQLDARREVGASR